jgi:hypothetical protein
MDSQKKSEGLDPETQFVMTRREKNRLKVRKME